MTFHNVLNNAGSTLTVAISTIDLAISVAADVFPAVPFYLTLGANPSVYEIVEVTAKTGLVFTIGRAKDGTTAKAYVTGDLAQLFMTAGIVNELQGEVTAHEADYVRQPAYINPTAGTSTAYTGSTTPTLSAYSEGVGVTIVPHVDSGVSPTFNWDGKGAIALFEQDGATAKVMTSGKPYSFKKVGTSFLADSSGAIVIAGQVGITATFAGAISKFDPVYLTGIQATSTKLANPAILPTDTGYGAAFSKDGVYMSVAHSTSPFVTIYKRGGDVFTKLTDPAILPTGTGNGVAFSPDGTYMSVAHSTSPFIAIYKRSGDVFTKLTDPASLPANIGTGVAFSPDGTYMAVAHVTSPFIAIYKRSGDVFTKLANPAILPTDTGNGVAFSPDGVYMSVAHSTSPFVTIYKRSGDVFTKLTNPAILPTITGNGVAFSQDGVYMAVAHYTAPYVSIYKGQMLATKSINAIVELQDKYGAGYANANGVLDDVKEIIKIWG